MAGRASVELKGLELGYDLSNDAETVSRVVEKVKDLESRGWSFEAADASFEMLLLDASPSGAPSYFTVESWRVIVEQSETGEVASEATVKVHVGGERILATAEGNGPVNALDSAMRKAVVQVYPQIAELELIDYKVRILAGKKGTGAVTRVLVSTQDDDGRWDTLGVHENVIAASWTALAEALTYGLLRSERTN